MTRRFAITLSVLASIACTGAASAQAPKTVLFVGNSYTGQVRATVGKFFAASEHKGIELAFITPGGRTLVQHLENAKTVVKITDGDWDVVVLQDQSQTPALFPKKFLGASEKLHALIEKAGAKTAYYQTWGRRDGDKRNAHLFPTYEKMQNALSKAYAKAAKRDGAILVPVGDAWREVRKQKADLGAQLYKKDGSHPSATGAYLAACCFYVSITGGDPRKVAHHGGLNAEEAKLLAEIANTHAR